MHIDTIFGGIGRFAVRFRWIVVIVWIAGTVAAVRGLPSLSSATQNNNQKFLPASAPSNHAATLAAPFEPSGVQPPIPVVAARQGGPLTAADISALTTLQKQLETVSTVKDVRDLGRSTDGHAEQLAVLASFSGGGNGNQGTTLVNSLRAKIAQAGLPAGLQAHVTGQLATQVDQQKANGNQGNQVQDFSALFIIVLLVLIFRSLTLALTTLIPAFLSSLLAGPLVGWAGHHGLQVSPIAQILLIVLVIGAGTDYGLFLVFRLREELGGRLDNRRDAVVRAVTRVGEAITFSAGTVIAALLTLLAASFAFYSDLGVPLAIGIGVILLAGLTLLPALLSLWASGLAVKRRVFIRLFGRPNLLWDVLKTGRGGAWGRVAGRIVRHPAPTLLAGVVLFGALAVGSLGYKSAGFGGNTNPPAGSDSAAGQALLTQHFPQSSANPTNLIFTFAAPVWQNPAPLASVTGQLRSSGLFTQVSGPLNPVGTVLTPADYTALHAKLGPAKALPPEPPKILKVPPSEYKTYQAYRATGNFVSPDGRTVQYATGLKAGDPSTTQAMNAVPSIRAETTSVAKSVGATDSAVGGLAPALYDISSISGSDLQRVVPIAILAIGVLLALVMRSLIAPLYLIASVGISFLAALGLATLLFIDLGSSGGLTFFLPFLMFIFLLALGEDYNILVMTRIREEARNLRLRDAVARALAATGTTVTSAGLVLAGTFLILVVVAGRGSGGTQFRDIGVGLAAGILMDTFLVRTLLVPSTVVLLGRWNWWPSRMSRRHATLPSDQAPAAAMGAAGSGDSGEAGGHAVAGTEQALEPELKGALPAGADGPDGHGRHERRAMFEDPIATAAHDTAGPGPAGASPPVSPAVTRPGKGGGPPADGDRPVGNSSGLLADGGSPSADGAGTLVAGRIRQPGGEPARGAAVTLIDASGRQAGRANAGPDGSFQLAAPGVGVYTLIAMAAAHQSRASTVRVGSAADRPVFHDVTLAGTTQLTGTVCAAGTSEPIVAATVTLAAPGGGVLPAQATDPSGRYLFTDLVAGDYTLAVSAPGREPAALPVTLADGGQNVQDVDLAGLSRLTGTARTADGRAVPDARVALLDPDGNLAAVTATGPDGRYTFKDLPTGDYTVVASGYPPVTQTVRVTPGQPHVHDPVLSHPEDPPPAG